MPKSLSSTLKKNQNIFIFLISFIVSIVFHFIFLADSLHGWTEVSATGGWSALGYYHIILFTLEFSIIINFFLAIIVNLKSNKLTNTQELKTLGDLAVKGFYAMFFIVIYLNILVFTFTKFSIAHNTIYLRQIMETLMYIPIYIVLLPLLFYIHVAPIHKIIKYKKEREFIKNVPTWSTSAKNLSKIITLLIFLVFIVIIQNLFILQLSN